MHPAPVTADAVDDLPVDLERRLHLVGAMGRHVDLVARRPRPAHVRVAHHDARHELRHRLDRPAGRHVVHDLAVEPLGLRRLLHVDHGRFTRDRHGLLNTAEG